MPLLTRILSVAASLIATISITLHVASAEPFVWIGAVNSSSFTVHADIPSNALRVYVSDTVDLSSVIQPSDPNVKSAIVGDTQLYARLRKFTFVDLNASTLYYVAYSTATPSDTSIMIGSVHTFPPEGTPSDLVIAFSSCQWRASWDTTFRDISKRYSDNYEQEGTPFMFLHMGDLAYSDISDNSVGKYEQAVRNVLTRPNVHSFFNSTAVAYMYDDHDYGPNNADASSTSRQAAVRNYLSMIPIHKHYDDAQQQTTYHSFTFGRILFIVTDLRSHSVQTTDAEKATTLGTQQMQWLEGHFANASSYALLVWLSTKPWIGDVNPGSDSWTGFHKERIRISKTLLRYNVSNLVMISGDAHMLAVDDGTNSMYTDTIQWYNVTGFPVFQAAPLHNFGSTKGGTYSHGCKGFTLLPTQQYAFLKISDSGQGLEQPTNSASDERKQQQERQSQQTCIELQGFRARRKMPLIHFKKCGRISLKTIKFDDMAEHHRLQRSGRCSIPLLPPWIWVVICSAVLWLTAVAVVIALFRRAMRVRAKS